MFKVDTIDDHYEFKSIAKKHDKAYEFIDRMVNNSKIRIEIIHENHLRVIRSGSAVMDMDLILNQKTTSTYHNDMGLSFEIASFTKEIIINDDEISFTYDYYIENDYQDTLKFTLVLNIL